MWTAEVQSKLQSGKKSGFRSEMELSEQGKKINQQIKPTHRPIQFDI